MLAPFFGTPSSALANEGFSAADLKEIVEWLADKNPDSGESRIVDAALEGIRDRIGQQVWWHPEIQTSAPADTVLSAKGLDPQIAYLEIGPLLDDGIDEVRARLRDLQGDWQSERGDRSLNGIIFDLRHAHGTNFHAAVSLIDPFIDHREPLIRIHGTTLAGEDDEADITPPIVALIGPQTETAAEALAYLIRDQSLGILIGTKTAGDVATRRSRTLSSGRTVILQDSLVQKPDRSPMAANGIEPDIEVTSTPSESSDPALDRATDFLKGLQVLKHASQKGIRP